MNPATTFSTDFFAIKDTTLSPGMLLPRPFARVDRYPFNDPSIRYHYLGRNASFALVEALDLAGQEMLFPAFFGPPVLSAPVAAGANMRFYPVREGLRTEVQDILAALTPDTKAIYLIHYAGFPAPIREVVDIARKVTGVDFPLEETGRRAGDPPALVADSHRIRELTGWKPLHDDLEFIIRTAWEWERKQK